MITKEKTKQFLNIFRRKYMRPLFYSILASIFLYLLISNIMYRKDLNKPHFAISSISKKFSIVEYMHMLLTIQEIIEKTPYENDLIEFVNNTNPYNCSSFLKKELYLMNWETQAFLVRVKKMFELMDIYDRIKRIDESIALLEGASSGDNYMTIKAQINILSQDKEEILSTLITKEEYEFIKEYIGVAVRIRRN